MTEKGSPTRVMVVPGQVRRGAGRQIRRPSTLRHDAEPLEAKWVIPYFLEKLLASDDGARTLNQLRWTGREYQGDRENSG